MPCETRRDVVTCAEIGLDEARRLRPIPSAYETSVVYELESVDEPLGHRWNLREKHLAHPYRKRYDSGRVDEWLESYVDESPSQTVRFITGSVNSAVRGLLTWRHVGWNGTVWLIDIRTDAQARRMGVGSAMLQTLKTETRNAGARGIFVETQINNYPALSFYKRQGFRICGFNDHLYTNRDLKSQDVALFLFWETREDDH